MKHILKKELAKFIGKSLALGVWTMVFLAIVGILMAIDIISGLFK
jgi:uncharacterized iron-regulated membrane protein